jgi:hypothetical protein
VSGVPLFTGDGTACPSTTVQMSVTGAAPSAGAFLVSGFSTVLLPFLGGTLVPAPDVITTGFATDAAGALGFGLTWPTGMPSGFHVYSQFWIADAAGPQGYSATNGLDLVTP